MTIQSEIARLAALQQQHVDKANAIGAQIAALRLQVDEGAPRYEDLVGKLVQQNEEFGQWLAERNYPVPFDSALKVQHINTTLTGHTVNLVTDSGRVIYHVPMALVVAMRRAWKEREG